MLEPLHAPFGGVANIYKHVEILAANGFEAYVCLREKPQVDFYGSSAPLLVAKLELRPGDICVVPELFTNLIAALTSAPVRRLMFCQNQYCLPFTSNPRAGIAEFGVHGIVVSSIAIRDLFRDVYGLANLPLVPYSLDTARFAPLRKLRQIAFMPRKLPEDAQFIAHTLQRRYARYADVPWVPIHGLTQRESARILGESAIFLSLSYKESFGLPPLEAMACGCLVAGYHGDGGREYMTSRNGWWAETGDWKACVDGLAAALDLFDRGGAPYDQHRLEMTKTVEQYSPERMEKELLAFWRGELSRAE